MDFEKIAENAYYKKGLDKYWELAEKYAYLQLENLYYRYRLGNISKENSIIEKKKIEKEYIYNRRRYEDFLSIHREYNENRIQYSILLSNIEKAKTKEEMMTNALKIIGDKVADDTFYDRTLQKFANLN